MLYRLLCLVKANLLTRRITAITIPRASTPPPIIKTITKVFSSANEMLSLSLKPQISHSRLRIPSSVRVGSRTVKYSLN